MAAKRTGSGEWELLLVRCQEWASVVDSNVGDSAWRGRSVGGTARSGSALGLLFRYGYERKLSLSDPLEKSEVASAPLQASVVHCACPLAMLQAL